MDEEERLNNIAAILQLIDENKLTKKVIQQLGYNIDEEGELGKNIKNIKENLHEIIEYGNSVAVNGFTYLSENVNFFDRNKEEIFKFLDKEADSLGINKLELINDLFESKENITLNDILAITKTSSELDINNFINHFNIPKNEEKEEGISPFILKQQLTEYVRNEIAYQFYDLTVDNKENIQTKYKQQAIKELNEYNNENEVKVSRKKGKSRGM